MKIRALSKRRAAGSRLYRLVKTWADAEHKRLDEIAERKMKEREIWLPPAKFAVSQARPWGVISIPAW